MSVYEQPRTPRALVVEGVDAGPADEGRDLVVQILSEIDGDRLAEAGHAEFGHSSDRDHDREEEGQEEDDREHQ